MNALLQTLMEEFHEKIATFTGSIIRDVRFPNVPDKIMVAIGMRRTGKTYLLFQTILELLKTVPQTRILYLNFEDDRLYPMTQQKLSELLDGFYALYPENHDNLCYLFLDEIQNVEHWHLVVRRYFDSKKVRIFLTGSSAKLLSKEIATSLRGRSMAIEVWPFSFTEFLRAGQVAFPPDLFGKKSLDQLGGLLEQYLEQGGFPETTFLQQPQDRRNILQDYVSVVVFRDIVERYKITNISLVKYMIKTLISNAGCSFSVHKFFNDLKSQAFAVSKTTIHDYLGYIEDAYLSFTVPLYSQSLRKTQTNPRKTYVIDTGLARAYSSSMSQNYGHFFENLVYLDLRRYGHTIHYYLTANRREVDFVSQDAKGKWHLYQVSWNIEDAQTLQRETMALEEAEKELGIKGECITPTSYFTSFLPNLSN
ncbi:MAG: ATP-binding protein [Alphaproteobacteria bacterium]